MKIKGTLKSGLSLLLAMLMVITLMPTIAYAEGEASEPTPTPIVEASPEPTAETNDGDTTGEEQTDPSDGDLGILLMSEDEGGVSPQSIGPVKITDTKITLNPSTSPTYVTPGSTAYISDDDKFYFSFKISGDSHWVNRTVKIDIPLGWNLISAPGVASCSGTKITTANYSGDELNIFAEKPKWTSDGPQSIGDSLKNYQLKSGILEYKIKDGSVDYVVNVVLQGPTHGSGGIAVGNYTTLYSYPDSRQQDLQPISVTMEGEDPDGKLSNSTDNVSIGAGLSGVTNNPVAFANNYYYTQKNDQTGKIPEDATCAFLGQIQTLNVGVTEAYNFAPINTTINVYNYEFDLVYPLGAEVSLNSAPTSNWIFDGAPVTNGSLVTQHVKVKTATQTVGVYNTIGRVDGRLNCRIDITYPKNSNFSVGNVYSCSIQNLSYQTPTASADGTKLEWTTHTAVNTPSTKTTIIKDPEFNPPFSSQSLNFENPNGYDGKVIDLASARTYINGSGTMLSALSPTQYVKVTSGSSDVPVRYCYKGDILDQVSTLWLPVLNTSIKPTAIHVDYWDGTSMDWLASSGETMPGTILYDSGGGSGTTWRYTPTEGMYVLNAYVEYAEVTPTEAASTGWGKGIAKGRPASDTYTGIFSHHEFYTMQSDGAGGWTKTSTSEVAEDTADHQKFSKNGATTNDHMGFRWTKPDDFKLVATPTNNIFNNTYAALGGVETDAAIRPGMVKLASYTFQNTTGSPSGLPIRLKYYLNQNENKDYVKEISFPYSYVAEAADAAKQVTKISWSYINDTTNAVESFTWLASSGDDLPFTPGVSSGVMTAPEGYSFVDLTVDLKEWNATTQKSDVYIGGVPTTERYTDLSSHKIVISTVDGATETLAVETTAGGAFKKFSAQAVDPMGTATTIDAGSNGKLVVTLLPNKHVSNGAGGATEENTNWYGHSTFAFILPKVLTPTSSTLHVTWRKNALAYPDTLARLVSSHDATAAEKAVANMSGLDAIVYIYEFDDQELSWLDRYSGRNTEATVTLPVRADSLSDTYSFTYAQLFDAGSTLDVPLVYKNNETYNTGRVLDAITYTDGNLENVIIADRTNTDNPYSVGVTENTVRGDGAVVTIRKNPALIVQEHIASSDGISKVYGNAEDGEVASYMKDEPGEIRLSIFNTVADPAVSVKDGYVFIPIPKASVNINQVTDREFDFVLNGEPTYTLGASESIKGVYIRYYNGTTNPTATNANSIFEASSETYDANCNMIAIKLDDLIAGNGIDFVVPIKAPSKVSNDVLYNMSAARSAYMFNSTAWATYESGERTGELRASFYHPEWTVTFNTKGATSVPSQTVEDAATIYNYDGVSPVTKFTEPEEPVKPGYDFGGWFTDDGVYENEYDFTVTPTANVTLYAKWTEKDPVTINYVADSTAGGTLSKATEDVKPISGTPTGSTVTVNPGYTFDGWYKGDDTTTPISTNLTYIPLKEDGAYVGATYTARFTANTDTAYTVQYYMKNVAGDDYTIKTDATENKTGTTDTVADVPSKTFTGFTVETTKTTYENSSTAAGSTALPIAGDGSLVVKVHYARKTYTVKFINDDTSGIAELTGTGSLTQTVVYGGSPVGEIGVNSTNSDYEWLGYNYETTLDDGTKKTGVIAKGDAYKTFEVLGDTIIKPYFAHVPYISIVTPGNGYVASENGNSKPTTIDKASDKIEWQNEDIKNAVLGFKAADHYAISSITVTKPTAAGDDTQSIDINLNNTELSKGNITPILKPFGVIGGSDGEAYVWFDNAGLGYIQIINLVTSANFEIQYKVIQHDVVFNSNGGTNIPTQTVDEGSTATKPANPTKSGYTFGGWYSNEALTTEYDFNTGVESDVTLYAKWIEKQVTISYTTDGHGSTDPTSELVGVISGTATGSEATANTGYHFINWTLGSTEVSTSTTYVPEKNSVSNQYEAATYQANFAPNTYSIKFNANGGTGTMSDQAMTYDVSSSLTTNTFTKKGYTFKGWAETDNGAVKYTNVESVKNLSNEQAGEVNLFAVWEANSNTAYQVNVYLRDIGSSTDYMLNSSASSPKTGITDTKPTYTTPTIEGFTLESGKTTYTDSTHTTPAKMTDTVVIADDGSLVINLYYSRNSHTVTYSYTNPAPTGAAAVPTVKTVEYGDSVTVADAPSVAGYTFSGWDKSNFTMPDENVTISGSWSANTNTKYTLQVFLKDVGATTYTEDTEKKQNLEGTTATTASYTAPTITGFTQETGKTTYEATGVDASTTVLSIAGDGSLVIKLYYTRNQQSISYEYTETVPTGAPAVPGSTNVEYGAPYTAATAPELTGYTFSGWSPSSITSVEADTVIKGSWTPNEHTKYTVQAFLKDVGATTYTEATGEKKDLDGTTATTASYTAPTIPGFTQETGKTTYEATGVDASTTVLSIAADGSLVIKLYYTRNQQSVSYQYTGTVPTGAPTVPGSTNVEYGAPYTAATAPELTGYTFSGWSPSSITSVEADTVINGSWTPNTDTKYTLQVFLKDVGTTTYTKDREEELTGTTATAAGYTAPSITGFTQETDKTTYEATGHSASTTVLSIAADGSLVIKLYYTRNVHTVTYNYTNAAPSGAVNVPNAANVEYGDHVTIAAKPSVDGYTFNGWDKTDFTMGDTDVTIHGTWLSNTDTKYAVQVFLKDKGATTYTKDDDKSFTSAGTTNTDASFTTPSFTGFTLESGKTTYESTGNPASTTKLTIAGDGSLVISLYYTRNKYSVTYKYTGTVPTGVPSVPSALKDVEFGSTVTATTNPTFEGYTFSGWSPASFEMGNADSVIEGSWTANTDTKYTVQVFLKDEGTTTYTENTDKSFTSGGTTNTDAIFTTPSITGFTLESGKTTYASTGKPASTTKLTIAGDGSLVIQLYYARNIHSVTYEYTGTIPTGAPGVPATANVEFGAKVKIADQPTFDGYTFVGWDHTDFTMGNENVKVTGSWTELESTITYDQNNNHGSITKTTETVGKVTGIPSGSTATAAAGYHFDGWYQGTTKVSSNPTYIPSKDTGTNLFEDVTYTAHFTADTNTAYTVAYYLQDTDLVNYTRNDDATENRHGTTDTAAIVPLKSFNGYAYEKTTYESTGIDPDTTALNIAGDQSLVVKVYYTRKTYTVEFVDPIEGGTLTADADVKNQSVLFGESPVGDVVVTEANSDYAWLGFKWVTTDDAGNTTSGTIDTDEYNSFVVKGNTTLTPYFAHIPFIDISSKGNGYVAATQGGHVPTVGTLTEAKYEWDASEVPPYNSSLAFKSEDHYKVSSITLLTPTITGSTKIDLPVNTNKNQDDKEDITELLKDNGFLEDDGTAFIWFDSQSKGYIQITGMKVSGQIEVTNEIIQHTLSIDTNNGEATTTKLVNDGSTVTKPADPIKNGYTFDGWYSDAALTTVYDFSTVVSQDVNLYAGWAENIATITYAKNSDHGSVTLAFETLGKVNGNPKGSTATAETGYKFTGWYLGDTLVTTEATQKPTKDTTTGLYETATYVAHFEPIQYEIVFDSNSSSATGTMANQSLKYNETQSLTGNTYTNSGYTFKGWSTSNTATTATYTNSQSITNLSSTDGSTVTLYAVWEVNKDTPYKVNVYVQDLGETTYTLDGTNSLSKQGTTNEEATYTSPTITGFTLESDKTTYEDSSNPAATDPLKITGDGSLVISLYYSRNQHSVTYQYVGTVPTGAPSVPTQADVAFGDTFTVDSSISTGSNDEVEGYTFSGWSQTGNVMMADADIVLEGTWIENGDTPYLVEHYVQKNDGTYATPKDTDHLTGKTNASVTAVSKTYTGYTLDPVASVKDGKIAGDGSLVLKLYYTQNAYEIKFDANSTTVTGSMDAQAMKYDTPAKLNGNEFTNPGYKFLGWSLTQSSTTAEFVNEEEVKQLSATNGATVTLYAVWQKVDPAKLETPVHVQVTVDTPSDPSTFTFEMSAVSTDVSGMTSLPMPNGAIDQRVQVNTLGSGSVGFGDITFTQPGKYVYEVHEIDGGVEGYTYDKEVYTVTYEITQDETGLHGTCVITKKDGTVVDAAAFVNQYKKPTEPTTPTDPTNPTTPDQNNPSSSSPYTGDHSSIVWYIFLSMSSLVAFACLILFKKRYSD